MYKRPEFRIKSEAFQAMLNDFIPTSIHWSGLASNKLEWILTYQMRNRLNYVEQYKYHKFDSEANELVFVGPLEFDGKQFLKDSGADAVFYKEIDRSKETFGRKQLPEGSEAKPSGNSAEDIKE